MFKGTALDTWRLEWTDKNTNSKEERTFLSYESLCDFAASLPENCTMIKHFKEA